MSSERVSPHIQYWDSCLFIELLTNRDPTRIAVLKELIEMEARGVIQIIISTFVFAEVRPFENATVPEDQFQAAVELLQSERLNIRPLTEGIALEAQRIGKENPLLLPGDCVHIATALSVNAIVLFTFDGAGLKRRRPSDMIAHSGKIKASTGGVPLEIREPYVPTGPLFDPSTESASP